MRLFACLLVGVLCFFYNYMQAQGRTPNLHGMVYVENHAYAEDAAITLMNVRDAVMADKTHTDKKGYYRFDHIPPGAYYISASKFNYEEFQTDTFSVAAGEIVTLPPINLISKNTLLKEVTVATRHSLIETKTDKVVINVGKGISPSGTSILDVLSAAPGVKVSSNDELTFKGGQPPLIMINGRATQLSQGDIQTMLRGMSSDNVELIELIGNPSAKYDAAGTGGVINIITRRGKDVGLNGSLTAGGGYGNFYKYNEGLNLNYRTKKVNIAGTFSAGKNKSDHAINTDRYLPGNTDIYSTYYNVGSSKNPTVNMSADIFIDSLHTFGFLFMGVFQRIDLEKRNSLDFIRNGNLDSTLLTTSSQWRHINQTNYNINYNGTLGHTNQTISADVDYTAYNRAFDEYLTTMFVNSLMKAKNVSQQYHNYVPVRYDILSAKVDYVKPIGKAKLEAGLKTSYVKSNNTQSFEDKVGSTYVPDTLSSFFLYHENLSSAYVNYTGRFTDKLGFMAGIRGEYTHSDGNSYYQQEDVIRNYVNFYPQLQLDYRANDDNRISFNYGRRTYQPSYDDLNPIIFFQDKYNYRQGNPFLRPSYENLLQLTHNYRGILNTELYFMDITDFSGFTYFQQDNITKTFVTTRQNLKSAITYGLHFNLAASLAEWWNINFDVNTSYQRYKDYEGQLNRGSFDGIFKLNSQFMLPDGFGINLLNFYEAPTYYAIYYYRSSYYTNATASKKIFGNRLSVNLSVNDIFNTRRDRYVSQYMNLDLIGLDKKETRYYTGSLTYYFGKRTIKARRRHISGDTEEQNRIGSGGGN